MKTELIKKIKRIVGKDLIQLFYRSLFFLSDEKYVKFIYRLRMGKSLNLSAPKAFSEKLQWLKVYDHNPKYSKMADKISMRDYVSSTIGEGHTVPILSVWDSFDAIDFDSLPSSFVLKTNHDSGSYVICRDKNDLDYKKAKKKIEKSLKTNYYKVTREWQYKEIKRKVIAEVLLKDDGESLTDYKFFCFDGEVKALFIAGDRMVKGEETKFDFFDENYNHLPFTNGHPNAKELPEKPVCFEEMKQLAAKLSKGYPHVRVDFYEVDGKVYFGEMTFFHWSGMTPFVPEEWDYTFGSWIKLPNVKTK